MESVALFDPSPFGTSLFDTPLPDPADTRSAVYFIASGNHVKVGKANNPMDRLSKLQIGSIHKMTMITWIPYEEPIPAERMWQRRFYRFRKRGEWFEIDAREVANLAIQECKEISRKAWDRKMSLFGDYMESVGYPRNPGMDDLWAGKMTHAPQPLQIQRRLLDEYYSVRVHDSALLASIDRSRAFQDRQISEVNR